MPEKTALDFQNKRLVIIDQSRLPNQICYRQLKTYLAIIAAIKQLKIRGAPLIGVAAAYALTLASQTHQPKMRAYLKMVARKLTQARPTAVNLSWAVNQMLDVVNNKNIPEKDLTRALRERALQIEKYEQNNSYRIGAIGEPLIKNNAHVMTICNTGWLAAPGIGTALGVIYTAHARGKKIKVYVLETRPALQGARLTAFELTQAKIPFTLITDSMIGTVMPKMDLVIAGADRIAGNGDTANKIGTLTLAITADYYKIPFYIAAPTSTFDITKKTGPDITIEIRKQTEIITCGKRLIAPRNANVFNPAFDITPAKLISGIITEKGLLRPPYRKSIGRFCFGSIGSSNSPAPARRQDRIRV